MPHLIHDDKKIYYEVHGTGEPLVILNGIMMSTVSWTMFLPQLGKDNQVILLDFFDQGQSEKLNHSYTQEKQVSVVEAVVHHLKLEKINLFGISYGGEVALHYALKHKHLINKLLLFNTTAYTNPWLDDIGKGWVKAAAAKDKELFYLCTIPIVYSPQFYTKNHQWMVDRKELLMNIFTEDFLNGMIRLTESASSHDLRSRVHELDGLKTLVVGSDYDFITPDVDQLFIHQAIHTSEFKLIKDCGHASMYEKPEQFTKLVLEFIGS